MSDLLDLDNIWRPLANVRPLDNRVRTAPKAGDKSCSLAAASSKHGQKQPCRPVDVKRSDSGNKSGNDARMVAFASNCDEQVNNDSRWPLKLAPEHGRRVVGGKGTALSLAFLLERSSKGRGSAHEPRRINRPLVRISKTV